MPRFIFQQPHCHEMVQHRLYQKRKSYYHLNTLSCNTNVCSCTCTCSLTYPHGRHHLTLIKHPNLLQSQRVCPRQRLLSISKHSIGKSAVLISNLVVTTLNWSCQSGARQWTGLFEACSSENTLCLWASTCQSLKSFSEVWLFREDPLSLYSSFLHFDVSL